MGVSDGQATEVTNPANEDIAPTGTEIVHVVPKNGADSPIRAASDNEARGFAGHGVPELIGPEATDGPAQEQLSEKRSFLENLKVKRQNWGKYIKTRDFWIVLVLGQVLSLCLTATNTFTELLSIVDKVNIPAFQNLFNYCILGIVYTSYTLYKYGFKKWCQVVIKDGWKYFLWAFCDVEGNYFFVLAYDYTTILSCTLIDFWAIVIVVTISFFFLKVRYHLSQYLGIFICIGGLGVLLACDYITHYQQFPALDAVKGDLFALLGASLYGLSNVTQEFFVSKRPVYEAIGQLGFWGMFINGVQAAIFNRDSLKNAVWKPRDGGYLTGYSLALSLFYSLTPLLLRMSSAAFFNISLLTSDFWAVIVGVQRFHLHIHWMYPIAFVLILAGLLVYFLSESIMGEAKKPWLGENQEKGVNGIGTARRKLERSGAVIVDAPGPEVV